MYLYVMVIVTRVMRSEDGTWIFVWLSYNVMCISFLVCVLPNTGVNIHELCYCYIVLDRFINEFLYPLYSSLNVFSV